MKMPSEERNKLIKKEYDKYSSVIADIYAEHHVNPLDSMKMHNKGIQKAMMDFALFYHEHQTSSDSTKH